MEYKLIKVLLLCVTVRVCIYSDEAAFSSFSSISSLLDFGRLHIYVQP